MYRPPELVSLRKLEGILGVDRRKLMDLSERAGGCYSPFDMRRSENHAWRHIDNPNPELKTLQRRISRRLLSTHPLPPYVFGCARGRSSMDNARLHVRQRSLATLDLRNCFPSISHTRVFDALREELNWSPRIARFMTKLMTVAGRLPQGAPSSPMLANVVLLPMYEEIAELAKEYELIASFYVDDIAVSGVRVEDRISELVSIIQKHGYAVRNSKVKLMPNSRRQTVTGNIVNRKLSVSREYRRELREEIRALAAEEAPDARRVLVAWGRLRYIKSVCPAQAAPIQRFAERYLPAAEACAGGVKAETRPCSSTHRHRRLVA